MSLGAGRKRFGSGRPVGAAPAQPARRPRPAERASSVPGPSPRPGPEIREVPGPGGSLLRAGASRPIPASEALEHSGGSELGTDLLGTGMAEFAEDVESLLPCVTRGVDVPAVVVDVAEEGERLRLAFGFADLPVQVASLL